MQQFLDAADKLIARYGTRSIALHMRQVGDDHFGAGCWLTAHHAYSAALTKGADCPAADRMSLHVNRAAARIKLQMWEEAVEDCDAALALDVTQGGLPKTAADGTPYTMYAAIIVKRVDAQTRSKTSINELLRA